MRVVTSCSSLEILVQAIFNSKIQLELLLEVEEESSLLIVGTIEFKQFVCPSDEPELEPNFIFSQNQQDQQNPIFNQQDEHVCVSEGMVWRVFRSHCEEVEGDEENG